MDNMFFGDMLYGLLCMVVIYLNIGIFLWVITSRKAKAMLIILVWPYVVYTYEGTHWYYKKTDLE
jgi:hypothetical protein